MMNVILTILAVLGLLILNEVWWRQQRVHGEFSRKFVHITVGSFVAIWPFFLSWRTIGLFSAAFLVVIVISKQLNLFRAIHSVQRPTWGEIYFALSVGSVAFLTQNKYVYAASLLQMSLADGLAAVMGIRYGGRHKYSVFGYAKSVIGTLTFFVTSTLILFAYSYASGEALSVAAILGIAGMASVIENVGIRGLDNLLVPALVALLLVNY